MPGLLVTFTGNATQLNSTIRHVVRDVGEMRGEVARALSGFAMNATGVYGVEEAMRHTFETAKELAHGFLAAQFTGEPRHVRRLAKIQELERSRGN